MALPLPDPPKSKQEPKREREAPEARLPGLPSPEEVGLPIPPAPKERAKRAPREPQASPPSQESRERVDENGLPILERDGVTYKKLPKSEYDAEGNPILQVDIDSNNLNNSADEFLSHLRQAPTKEELIELRKEYARKRKAEREAGGFS